MKVLIPTHLIRNVYVNIKALDNRYIIRLDIMAYLEPDFNPGTIVTKDEW